MNHPSDTIAAIATAPGEGGIAIVRIAGPQALALADAVFRGRGAPPSQRPPFTFVYGSVCDADGQRLDEVLLLIMRAPRSYTGEDQVEIQGHGGPVACRRILRRVLEAGARLAEPGEFTRRAFLNGRLDLIQAEAVLDLINARNERAAQAAVEQLAGSISASISLIYDESIAVNADLEATLDFTEDEVPPTIIHGLVQRLEEIRKRTEALLATWSDGRLLREGALIVIAGRPNVGKSTLMNVLLGHDRAIVSDTPGTTRDTIEEGYLLNGVPLRLVDTAGLRDTTCAVEREGIRRSRDRLNKADATLYVMDATRGFISEDGEQLKSLDPEKTLIIWNKMDLVTGQPPSLPLNAGGETRPREVWVSMRDGQVLDVLRTALAELLHTSYHQGAEQQAVISERHRDLLAQFLVQVRQALSLVASTREDQIPLASQHLRDGLERLGTATGRIYHQELLDTIFSRFCIGK